jgi:hypothetical protein
MRKGKVDFPEGKLSLWRRKIASLRGKLSIIL